MRESVKLFSFFSGAGFLDLGFEKAGFEIAHVNEFSKEFLYGYKYSRAAMKIQEPEYGFDNSDVMSFFGGAKKKYLENLITESRRNGNVVGFVGGPPCPDFSNGGNNYGSEGPSGRLSSVYVNLIIQQQPDFFVFENVKGLYQTKKHREYFDYIKRKLQAANYATDEQILNTLEYGVPQHRERLIFIGFNKKFLADRHGKVVLSSDKVLPFGFLDWDKFKKFQFNKIKQHNWPKTNPFEENSKLLQPENIIQELTVENWFQKNRVWEHENTLHCFVPKALSRFRKLPEGDTSKKSFKRLHRWKYSPAACYGNNEVHLHPYEARRISVAEALALQSLPPDFVLPGDLSLSHMFKTVGNGVPFLAAKGIAKTIMDCLE